MKLKKILPAAAVLAGTTLGSLGGYFYHEAEVSPTLLSLGGALELITGREAKAQAAYEASQEKLAALQDALLAQEEKHKAQLAVAHSRRTRAESSLRAALAESGRRVAVAADVPIPKPVIIPDDPADPEAQAVYLSELKTCCTAWKFVAETRQDAINGLEVAQSKFINVNRALVIEVQQEEAYRSTIERDRNLWKERFTLADERVEKLKGSRRKWMAGAIAGAIAGVYLGGR